jgi:hypothetical protein
LLIRKTKGNLDCLVPVSRILLSDQRFFLAVRKRCISSFAHFSLRSVYFSAVENRCISSFAHFSLGSAYFSAVQKSVHVFPVSRIFLSDRHISRRSKRGVFPVSRIFLSDRRISWRSNRVMLAAFVLRVSYTATECHSRCKIWCPKSNFCDKIHEIW